MLFKKRRSWRLVYNVIHFSLYFYFKAVLGAKITGKIKTKDRSVLFVANHRSFNDPPFLGTFIFSFRRSADVFALGKSELFNINPLFTRLLTIVHAIPLDRTGMDATAIKYALTALEHDNYLVIFPEGTRNKTEGLLEGKAGAGYIALKSGVKVIPVYLKNTDKPFIRQFLRIDRIEMIIGDPIVFPPMSANSKNSKLVTQIMMKEIGALND